MSEIIKFDILCFTETKTDNTDIIDIPGFTCFPKHRRQLSQVKSGGIAVYVRNNLKSLVKCVSTPCEFVLWVVLNIQNNDCLIGAVYIPPENSKYVSPDVYDQIEEEYLTLAGIYKHVCLIGDFNSRTAEALDFITDDELDMFDLENIDDSVDKLIGIDASVTRQTKDHEKNHFGNLLLQFCKHTNLFILNGRVGQDKLVGATTCKDVSVIDYCIGNYNFMSLASDFVVLPFSKLLSDIHNPITVTLNVSLNNTKSGQLFKDTSGGKEVINKWDDEGKDTFCQELSNYSQDVNSICDELANLDSTTITSNCVNETVKKIGTILLTCAKTVFGSRIVKQTTVSENCINVPKQWFTKNCKNARMNLRKAKRMFKKYGNRIFKEDVILKEKMYKKTMDNAIKEHRHNMRKKLKQIRTKNPKEYWKVINTCNRKNKVGLKVDIIKFFEFYKELNTNRNVNIPDYVHSKEELDILSTLEANMVINAPITTEEIIKCIKQLKRNKSAGEDCIYNEYIKASCDIMLPLYTKLFNVILDSGIFPTQWLCGDIIPIYKNKGDETEPKNYRPITLLCCLGKLFTSVINERLNNYADAAELVLENQAGFRKNHSTIDHIFTLHMLIEIYKNMKKKLYCAFIDFESAFDKVWRLGLWNKLLTNNIDGKCFRIIKNMYNGIKARIKLNGMTTDTFPCELGVRQGENLSPFLFSIFLNDLEGFLKSTGSNGLPSISKKFEQEFQMYFNIFVLLYADDTILLAESPAHLQSQLNQFSDYCERWKLKVNVDKTKIMIFGKRFNIKSDGLKFEYQGKTLEIVQHFKYLGVYYSSNGSFVYNVKQQYDKATKAMFGILSKCKCHNLSHECQLDLFDKMLQPILLYGCEVWGFSNLSLIEKLHLKFCKYILKVHSKTPNCMVYGELGRYPLAINVKARIIALWVNCITHGNKLMSQLYGIMYGYKFKWDKQVKCILNECGLSYIWESHQWLNVKGLDKEVKRILKDQFLQNWNSTIQNSPKCLNYRIFKENLELEPYINILQPKYFKILCRFRTCNMKLPIETGRWQNIPRQNRLCTLCNMNEIGDEFHYLFNCSEIELVNARKKFMPKYYYTYPNTYKFKELFKTKKVRLLIKLCKLIKIIGERITPPG